MSFALKYLTSKSPLIKKPIRETSIQHLKVENFK